jgi:hypothetical protein
MAAISALAFLAGLPFPITANLSNPYLGYGIVFISIPAWTIGAITGGIAAYAARAQAPETLLIKWLGSGLLLLNAAAVALAFLIPFHAS